MVGSVRSSRSLTTRSPARSSPWMLPMMSDLSWRAPSWARCTTVIGRPSTDVPMAEGLDRRLGWPPPRPAARAPARRTRDRGQGDGEDRAATVTRHAGHACQVRAGSRKGRRAPRSRVPPVLPPRRPTRAGRWPARARSRVGLDDVGRRAPGVPRTLDALHRAERRHAHLDGATRRPGGQLLEQIARRVAQVGAGCRRGWVGARGLGQAPPGRAQDRYDDAGPARPSRYPRGPGRLPRPTANRM